MQASTPSTCQHCGHELPNPYFLNFENDHVYCTQTCMEASAPAAAYALVGDVAQTDGYHRTRMLKREWT
jgi:hypothetical protein